MELAPRHFPSGLRVENIGYLPRKTDWIDLAYECYNFSLILNGRGRYESPDFVTEIVAPCVITQSPGTIQNYGPDEHGWTEIYLVYDKLRLPELKARRFWPQPLPCWSVRNVALFRELTQLLISRLQLPTSVEQADYLDRLVEQCILVSLMPAPATEKADPHRIDLLDVVHHIDANLNESVDWEACAQSIHMPLSTFRRHWLEQIGVPPGAYLTRRRMEEAARLLVSSGLPINEIAERVGYPDPLHFSRVFRRHFDTAPRGYRKARGR